MECVLKEGTWEALPHSSGWYQLSLCLCPYHRGRKDSLLRCSVEAEHE